MKYFYSAAITFLFTNQIFTQIFISPSGIDGNPGTIDLPLKTIPAAVTISQPGDTIYLRGGTYPLNSTISISKDGASGALYHLFSYQDERPLLDFSLMPVNSSNRGIILSGDYWYVKGIDIRGAGDNGMNLSGSSNIIEFCSFFENHDTGLQLGGGASNNQIINCDSYFNEDPGQGNADGFAPKLTVGSGNYFYGCRAWQNSDDGWDGYMRGANDVSTTLENCWCFANGYLKDGSAGSGNGNGYKMGGSDDKTLMHNFTLKNCIAFDNLVRGFDQNNNRGSMALYNCTAFRNGTNYSITLELYSGKTATIINSVALDNYGSLASFVNQQTNSWLGNFDVTNDDFISIDTTGVRGPRKADGNLPDINFLHLAYGSNLIDAGTDVGIPFYGLAPDLGAFESGGIDNVIFVKQSVLQDFKLAQNYPNPFNPNTKFRIEVVTPGFYTLTVYNVLGKQVASLVDDYKYPGAYEITWDAKDSERNDLPSGIYIAKLKSENQAQTIKLSLIK